MARFDHRQSPPRNYKGDHARLRPLVLARDGRCLDCGSTENLQAGHIDRHGPDTMANYRTQCRSCNLAQASREARNAQPASPQPRPATRW